MGNDGTPKSCQPQKQKIQTEISFRWKRIQFAKLDIRVKANCRNKQICNGGGWLANANVTNVNGWLKFAHALPDS